MHACGSGMAVVFSSHARMSQNDRVLPKSTIRFRRKTAPNEHVAMDGNQAGMRNIPTNDISLLWYYRSDRCAFSAVWVSASGPFYRSFVDLPKNFR